MGTDVLEVATGCVLVVVLVLIVVLSSTDVPEVIEGVGAVVVNTGRSVVVDTFVVVVLTAVLEASSVEVVLRPEVTALIDVLDIVVVKLVPVVYISTGAVASVAVTMCYNVDKVKLTLHPMYTHQPYIAPALLVNKAALDEDVVVNADAIAVVRPENERA